MNTDQQNYWTNRYKTEKTGWDIGYLSTPIKNYIDQLENKDLKILIPGAGNAYEAEYIFSQGFKNIYILDISVVPLKAFELRNPEFPKSQILHDNFFKHYEKYDLIIEQTFFCSFAPSKENRTTYVTKMYELLNKKGKLVGLWFNIPLTSDMEKRPFGGDKKIYEDFLKPHFIIKTFKDCFNSIPERANKELFGIFEKK